MGMSTGGGGGIRSEINVTPLVDVVLVLLIIFMVITPMLQKGKAVELPSAKNVASRKGVGGKAPPDPLVVAVTKDEVYFVDKAEVKDLDKLAEAISKGMEDNPEAQSILVKADKTVTYGKLRPVFKALEKLGQQSVSLAAAELKAPSAEGEDAEGEN